MKKFIKKNKHVIIIFLVALLLLALTYFINWDTEGVFSSRESLQLFIESFGAIGPFVLIFVIALEVVIAPLPGFIPAVTAGFVFGPIWGAFYVYIGNLIGSLAVFFLVRHYGYKLAKLIFKPSKMERYRKAISRHENWLLAFYFIPIFPLDVITAAFGLSAIKPKKFILAIMSGFLFYAVILAFFGDILANLYFKVF